MRLALMVAAIIIAIVAVATSAPCDPPAEPVQIQLQWDGKICDPPVQFELPSGRANPPGVLVVPVPPGSTMPTIINAPIPLDIIDKCRRGTIRLQVTWPPEAKPAVTAPDFWTGNGGLYPGRLPSSGPKIDLRGLRDPHMPRRSPGLDLHLPQPSRPILPVPDRAP